MPNYCDNSLTISGKQKEVVKFLNAFTNKDEGGNLFFSMEKIIPQPASPDDEGFDWYHWRLEHWGCKWDIDSHLSVEEVYDEIITSNDSDADEYIEVYLPYTTPWGPNLEFIQRASAIFNNVVFNIKYYEPGCELAGDFTYEGGDETENFCYDGSDDFEFYVWAIENDFESSEYVLDEMELEETDKELYDRLNEYFYPSNETLEETEEGIIDLSNMLLGNNLPKPQ